MKLKHLKTLIVLVLAMTKAVAQQHKTLSVYTGEAEVKAGKSITFLPGFHVPSGSEFKAFISTQAGCDPVEFNPASDKNYVITYSSLEGGARTVAQLMGMGSCEVNRDIEYFDGLGRPLQKISLQSSSTGGDIVQPFTYDKSGRNFKQFLPFIKAGTQGTFVEDGIAKQNAYYLNPPQEIRSNSTPYAESRFETSPLGRVLEQSLPGGEAVGNEVYSGDHTLKQIFKFNTDIGSKKIALYTATTDEYGNVVLNRENGNKIYKSGELSVTVFGDENTYPGADAGTVEEYKDKQGKLIVRRSYNYEPGKGDEMLSTYFVYDQYGNLCFVLPPLSEADNDNAITEAKLSNICYQYRYDQLNRLIEKKQPSKGWEYFVYNKLDQVVLSQDANQRNNTPQEWSFAKYDGLGRPVLSGIFQDQESSADQNVTSPSNSYRKDLQNDVYNISDSWEIRDNNSSTGYSNLSFPTTGIASVLSSNYYDNYDIPGLPAIYNRQGDFSKMTSGLPTATRTAVLNNPQHSLWSAFYYDDQGQPVKVFLQHYKGSVSNIDNYDEISSSYDFTGHILSTLRVHKTGGIEKLRVANSYDYDHKGRKLNTWQRINGGTNILLSHYEYNDIDQLIAKKVHSEDGGNSYLQTTRYTYHPRGWPETAMGGLFNLGLLYDNPSEGLEQFNGNLSGYRWGSGNGTQYTLDFWHDSYGRLVKSDGQGLLMKENVTYDKGGNIKSLTRDGNTISYNYTIGNANRLLSVSGAGLQSNEYKYDLNGNAIKDGSKNDLRFEYNVLNLPKAVTGNQNISYTYDANGAMLSKNSASTGLTEYISGIQYGSKSSSYGIDFVWTEEGRAVRQSDNTYRYEYDLKDHLGNIRVVFNKDPITGQAVRKQEDIYYPFGKRRSIAPVSLDNEYLYNGKELQEEFGQYDYGARFYDPETARWNAPDPMGEKYAGISPYVYGGNNPVYYTDPDGMQLNAYSVPVNGDRSRMWNPDGGPGPDETPLLKVDLPEVKVTRKAMTEGERFNARYSRGDRAFFYADGRPDYAAYRWKQRMNEARLAVNRSRDPAVDLITVISVASTVGDVYLAGEGIYYFGARYLASRAASKVGLEAVTEVAVEGGYSTIYRAVSQAEVDDIAKVGLRVKEGGYETGKLFAPTLEEAAQFGKYNFGLDGIPNTIMEVRVPNSVLNSATKFGADGMNAISIQADKLHLLKANPLNFSPW